MDISFLREFKLLEREKSGYGFVFLLIIPVLGFFFFLLWPDTADLLVKRILVFVFRLARLMDPDIELF